MMTFFSVVGCLVVLLLSVAAVFSSWGYLVECRTKAQRERDQFVKTDAKKEVGNLMLYSYHWFSEDVGAWNAVKCIGEALQRSGDFRVDDCRDVWRDEMKKAEGVHV